MDKAAATKKTIFKSVVYGVTIMADIVFSNLLVFVLDKSLAFVIPSDTMIIIVTASVWGYIHYVFEVVNKMQVSFSGDVLEPGSAAVLVCNKQSLADYVVLQILATTYGMRGRVRFLCWRAVFARPSLAWLAASVWVRQDWTFDFEQLNDKLSKFFKPAYWLVMFPETVSYETEIWQEQVRYCQSNGLPKLAHLLYPRFEAFFTSAFVPIMKYVKERSDIKFVYDVTIVYHRADEKNQSLGLWDLILMAGNMTEWEINVNVKRIPINEVGPNRRGMERWLEKTWVRKDKLLDGVARKGMAFKGLGYVYFPTDYTDMME
ncbi:hypothetical protein V1514DRAFT_321449 [Lipomyces japonicus]|uniref:uncharacterized protein n=1 Tax=Lipomyces japonicus TaxID=56871 RepID=UPI0034CF5915